MNVSGSNLFLRWSWTEERRIFRGLDILTIKWAICDSPNECRFLLNTQVMFLKREKDPTTKLFDDEEWIRSLTEAQEITVDIQENVANPILMGVFLRKHVSRRLLALNEG